MYKNNIPLSKNLFMQVLTWLVVFGGLFLNEHLSNSGSPTATSYYTFAF